MPGVFLEKSAAGESPDIAYPSLSMQAGTEATFRGIIIKKGRRLRRFLFND
jgi:hypothetical protein